MIFSLGAPMPVETEAGIGAFGWGLHLFDFGGGRVVLPFGPKYRTDSNSC